jgi:hypothetical protein
MENGDFPRDSSFPAPDGLLLSPAQLTEPHSMEIRLLEQSIDSSPKRCVSSAVLACGRLELWTTSSWLLLLLPWQEANRKFCVPNRGTFGSVVF